ncbi:MAG: hypothetical protein E7638_04740 [Ruminococcaceae bacterium]|nr:hypothetical protein [Oscillospiraceae bacterium]
MSEYEKIIYAIRKAMKAKKVKCADIGALLGLGREMVNQKLNGHRKFYFWEIIEICEYLGLELTISEKTPT